MVNYKLLLDYFFFNQYHATTKQQLQQQREEEQAQKIVKDYYDRYNDTLNLCKQLNK